jgi:hypothetical protein
MKNVNLLTIAATRRIVLRKAETIESPSQKNKFMLAEITSNIILPVVQPPSGE